MNIPWQDRFADNAALLPFYMDMQSDQIMLARLAEEDYREISFLDQRIITPQLPRQLVGWDELSAIPLAPYPKPQYIFHIGHVGSTLISRLLGEHNSVLALREPAILRQFSELYTGSPSLEEQWDSTKMELRLDQVQNWFSRTFHKQQRAMIKASSFVSPLAEILLEKDRDALFLFVSLERYLQTILAGESSLQEAEALADLRLMRLNRHLDDSRLRKSMLSIVNKIALGWLCEMVTLTKADRNLSEANIIWMDFDAFLTAPEHQLSVASQHFGLDFKPKKLEMLLNSSIMTSYSKAQEYDYSPSLREELLNEAAQKHATEISATMQWVDKLANEYQAVALALEQAEKR